MDLKTGMDYEIVQWVVSRYKLRSTFLPQTQEINISAKPKHVPLGRVDKMDSHQALSMFQAGICYGDQLGTRLDVGRGMGIS